MPSPTEPASGQDRMSGGPRSRRLPAPGLGCGTFDGRFPGSRLSASGHLPGFPVVSRPSACRLQLRGQPRIRAKCPSPCSLFIPLRGTVPRLIRAAVKRRQRESSRNNRQPKKPSELAAATAPATVTTAPITVRFFICVGRPEILIARAQAMVPTPICTRSMPPI